MCPSPGTLSCPSLLARLKLDTSTVTLTSPGPGSRPDGEMILKVGLAGVGTVTGDSIVISGVFISPGVGLGFGLGVGLTVGVAVGFGLGGTVGLAVGEGGAGEGAGGEIGGGVTWGQANEVKRVTRITKKRPI